MATFAECEECGKVIGEIIFSWFDPPEFVIYDNGMKLYPEVPLCEECLDKIDPKLAEFVRKGTVINE
jgi:hypothetical protein